MQLHRWINQRALHQLTMALSFWLMNACMHFVKGYKSKERALSTGMEQNKKQKLKRQAAVCHSVSGCVVQNQCLKVDKRWLWPWVMTNAIFCQAVCITISDIMVKGRMCGKSIKYVTKPTFSFLRFTGKEWTNIAVPQWVQIQSIIHIDRTTKWSM